MLIIDKDSETSVVVGTAIGPLTVEEIRRAAASVWRDVEGPSLRVLWDLRLARFEFSAVEVRALAEFARQNSPYPDLRMAFVVARDLEFGLVRIFEALRETARARVAVFREKDEALAWLGGQEKAGNPGLA
jgi:hypothetical protein